MLNVLLLLLSLVSLAYSSCSNSYVPGTITYTTGSTSNTGYIIQAGGSQSWGTVATSGSQVTVGLGPRFYLANSCATAFSSTVFQKFNPLGSTISFTVNVNNVGCGQDAAFYLVGMPASGAGSNGDYYCDANCVGGACCVEMDLFEANRHAIQITAHTCSSSTSCDGGGCALNTQSISNGYGPSSSYTINSQNSYTVSITFSSSPLSTITSVISQGSKSITLTHTTTLCGSGYLAGLDSAFTSGVVPVWSYWSGSMSWLDSSQCSSDTSDAPSGSQFIFSGLSISSGGTVAPVPPKAPVAPPVTPVAPKAPVAPQAPSSQHCGNTGCTINSYWVEFTPPAGATNIPSTASVKCNEGTWSCNWYSSVKYQCSTSPSTCTSPIPYYNGVACPFASSETVDTSAMDGNMGGLSTAGIAAVAAVACIVVVVAIVVIVIVVVKKRQTMENV